MYISTKEANRLVMQFYITPITTPTPPQPHTHSPTPKVRGGCVGGGVAWVGGGWGRGGDGGGGRGVGRFFPLSPKPAHHRYQYEPGHACCALLEAGRPRAGRSRFARSAVTPCPRRESKSRPSSPHTAGSSADRRLLFARAKRECTTTNEAAT